MNHPSQEDLLGYVLGAMDAQEQRELQQHLDDHPETEEQLLAIKASLVPLDLLDAPGHRPGLARRTCESVAGYDTQEAAERLSFLDSVGIENIGWNDQLAISDFPVEPEAELDAPKSPLSLPASAPNDTRVTVGLRQQPEVNHPDSDVQSVPLTGEANLPLTPAAMSSDKGRHAFRPSWSFTDLLVGVAALAILASVLLPAVSWSRYYSRLASCQNNLRQVGSAFMMYSSINDGGFVDIPAQGNLSASGCYGPILKDAGLLSDDSLLACAGLGSSVAPVFIPSCQQVRSATPEEAEYLKQTMGGHFGHTMGYCKQSQYVAPRNGGQSFLVLLADRPSNDQPGRTSLNHAGQGQNCLFADGRVEFVKGHAYGGDALFENDYGVVAPGSSESDNVIAPSHLSPTLGIQMSLAPTE